jgi:VIT1/CCC1 family predicted Fe2+/Mn2+ transporter
MLGASGYPPHTAFIGSPSLVRWRVPDLRGLSFGGPAAIVTSMGLIVGLDAATTTKAAVVASLLVIGLADNLTDSLSVHIYQESERLAHRRAFHTTVSNFFARLLVTLSFVLLFVLTPKSTAIAACVVWGFVLLSGLSYLLAKARQVNAFSEICKHIGVAFTVIVISKTIGLWVLRLAGSA